MTSDPRFLPAKKNFFITPKKFPPLFSTCYFVKERLFNGRLQNLVSTYPYPNGYYPILFSVFETLRMNSRMLLISFETFYWAAEHKEKASSELFPPFCALSILWPIINHHGSLESFWKSHGIRYNLSRISNNLMGEDTNYLWKRKREIYFPDQSLVQQLNQSPSLDYCPE